ncbi:MAG: UvrD-helicase domain-containing protein [Desulfomonile tiedjei]|nr:UvrD-helicase domain-containing protein [Desulfomonile tiedjei]
MIYFADLHVHSKYSRATSRDCDLMHLAQWAALKGIRVLGTGDFTHPGWRSEIKEKLVEAENGLLRLKDEHVPENVVLPRGFGPGEVRFVLNGEISSIYKKDGATRKVHHVIHMPDIDAMERFSARLDRIGNIRSDGRPILGLDSRDLLEIALDTSDESYLVLAHIWTPWFSVFGSRSGFDTLEACFEELTPHIFALETGLSSDPEMNHRVSRLDRFTLLSNSDTHSPAKLGREANIFQGIPGYVEIREAIRAGGAGKDLSPTVVFELTGGDLLVADAPLGQDEAAVRGSRFIGTIEFFPEEGKYHLDGHRKCGVRLEPEETEKLGGRCPVCGQPVTVGVMNRVFELADRDRSIPPENAAPFWRLLPLTEVIGQALGVGPQSKKVGALYQELLHKLGPELLTLWACPLEEIGRHAPAIITEAIRRVRAGEVSIAAGFDGEYGKVQLFGEGERAQFAGQDSLVEVEKPRRRKGAFAKQTGLKKKERDREIDEPPRETQSVLNDEQLAAARIIGPPVLVQAGPGTGKTRTLTQRIAFLIEEGIASPAEITAVTFTRKASQEMRGRLSRILTEERSGNCWLGTFHQLGACILDLLGQSELGSDKRRVLDEDEGLRIFREAVRSEGLKTAPASIPSLYREVSLLKQNLQPPDELADSDLQKAYRSYERRLEEAGTLDLDDLIAEPVRRLREDPDAARRIAEASARHLLVDEFQDVNKAQYELIRLLADPDGTGLFVIGDPDQAIYGFRGADRRFFLDFASDYPATRQIRLVRNYRSQAKILRGAENLLNGTNGSQALIPHRPGDSPVRVVRLPNAVTEAEFIIRTIDAVMGGASFFSIDSRNLPVATRPGLGFGDFAVLYRLNTVGDTIEQAFRKADIPYQRARKATTEEEAEALDPRAHAVTLMTIHASKGLEFPVVFVAGVEDGIIPYVPPGQSISTRFEPEEERRLLYVAMTRASDDLFLTRADRRTVHGMEFSGAPSRFLDSLDPAVVGVLRPLGGGKDFLRRPTQGELFG